jgi:hypothetical protein
VTIARYLRELHAALVVDPWTRRRVLAETEDHLRSAVEAGASESEAVARFGSPSALAARFAEVYAARVTRGTAWLLLGLLVVAFMTLYPIPENTLPPAPWPEDSPPGHLMWKRDLAVVLFAVAAVLGIAAALLRQSVRTSLALTGGALVVLAATTLEGAVLAWQWHEAVPGAPGPRWIVPAAVAQAALIACVAGIAASAFRARLAATNEEAP